MIVITSMNELPHSCMSCPFQKNQKTPFCRAKRNYCKSSLSNIPPAFGFYIKDDAFLEGQTPWNARAKWCPLIEVADIKTEPTISKMEQVDELRSDARKFLGYACETCKHKDEEWDSEACDGCCENNDHYEPQTERSE